MSGIEIRSYEIKFHPDAVADLRGIAENDMVTAERLRVFFDEYLVNDPHQRNSLAVDGFENEIMHITRWVSMCEAGYEVWRIKLQGYIRKIDAKASFSGKPKPFLHHRVPYAYVDSHREIWILGIFERGAQLDDYDASSDFGQRVKCACAGLGL